jgi:hypothetical protein
VILVLLAGGDVRAGSLPPSASSAEPDARARASSKARRELEAVSLQVLIAPMFSGRGGGTFGTGAAGRQWQAMMTEQIARAVAAGGRLRLLPGVRPATAPVARRDPSHGRQRERPNGNWYTMVTRQETPTHALRDTPAAEHPR